MLIIEIALGIVLAVIILKFLPEILGFGVAAISIGIILILAAVVIYFLYQGASSPEVKTFLDYIELNNILGTIVGVFFIWGLYMYSMDEKTIGADAVFTVSLLIISFLIGVMFVYDLLNGSRPPSVRTFGFIICTFITPAILLFLRWVKKYGLPTQLEPVAKKISPSVKRMFGFERDGEGTKVEQG